MNRLLIALTLFGIGCGGSSISIDDYYAKSVKIECEFVVKCCTTGTPMYTSVDDCVTKTTNPSGLTALKAQIAAGTVRYDGAAASACSDLDSSLLSSCTNTITSSSETHLLGVCDGIVVGTKKAGASCDPNASYSQCDNQSFCSAPTSGASVCTAYGTNGSDCSGTPCGSNLYCDDTNKCASLKSKGTSCTNDNECSTGMCTTTCVDATPVAVTTVCPMQTSN